MEIEARLWKGLGGGKVECTACARRCRIPTGSRGFCYVRHNPDGTLRLANYGRLEAMQVDPIEKKPFNHFMPGTRVFGIGTSSCNFGCLFCQNHKISKEKEIKGIEVSPEEVVRLALENQAQGIAYTYNEPAIFIEYALAVARLAKKRGLFNVFVTNGYLTGEAVDAMRGKIDAVVVNLKGNGEEKFVNKYEMVMSNKPVREALVALKRVGIHIEMTDLVIPRVGDSLKACDELTKWIAEELGKDTPIQFIRFHPDYKVLDCPETPYETLLAHREIARRNGLRFVYIGNVPDGQYESTYCPGCNGLLIGRDGFRIGPWNLDRDNRCAGCRRQIPILGGRPEPSRQEGIRALY